MAFVANKDQRSVHEQDKAKLRIFYSISDTKNILKVILTPDRLVPSSYASAPRNSCEAGISTEPILNTLSLFVSGKRSTLIIFRNL